MKTEPGLLPRALDVIFSSLDVQHQLSDIKMHPERFSELRVLSDKELAEKEQWKDDVLNMVSRIKQGISLLLLLLSLTEVFLCCCYP